MSYEWPLDPQDLFGERYAQMTNTGLPAGDVDAVRDAVTDMWADAPGGWAWQFRAPEATLAPGQWVQISGILSGFGVKNAFARVVRTSGNSRITAYGVVNDGATPTSGATNDGSYIFPSR